MPNRLGVLVIQHCLQWLGHVGRMNDNRLPKKLLFGELLPTRPAHGPKLRWRDLVLRDLQSLGFDALGWFNAAQDRSHWLDVCQSVLPESTVSVPVVGPSVNSDFFACGCGRIFRKSGDLACHRRFCGGQPPQLTQQIFNCGCGRTFRRQGDLTRHQQYCCI